MGITSRNGADDVVPVRLVDFGEKETKHTSLVRLMKHLGDQRVRAADQASRFVAKVDPFNDLPGKIRYLILRVISVEP